MSTKIEWATDTWNPITGCTPISPGCANCYAKRMANRLQGRYGYPKDEPFRVTLHEDKLDQPLHWKKPRRIFVSSMGDLFHENVDHEDLVRVFEAMANAGQHTYLLLTKRPGSMAGFFDSCEDWDFTEWPNIWLGTSCENQKWADKRIPELLKIPAAVRWLSLEPLLGPIDLKPWLRVYGTYRKTCKAESEACPNQFCECPRPDWVVIGCESGPGRRPCRLEWVIDIVEQCTGAGIPVYIKQLSLAGKVEHDMAKFPKWAQRREWPKNYRKENHEKKN